MLRQRPLRRPLSCRRHVLPKDRMRCARREENASRTSRVAVPNHPSHACGCASIRNAARVFGVFLVASDTRSGDLRSKFVHAPELPFRTAGTTSRIAWPSRLHRCDACIIANEKNHTLRLVFGLFLKTGEVNSLNVWMAVRIASSHRNTVLLTLLPIGCGGEGIDFMAEIN